MSVRVTGVEVTDGWAVTDAGMDVRIERTGQPMAAVVITRRRAALS